MQENHLQTLTTLKREWTAQQVESSKEIQRLQREQQLLLQRVKEQQMTIESLKSSEVALQHQLNDMSIRMRLDQQDGNNKNDTRKDDGKTFATTRDIIEDSAIDKAATTSNSTELSSEDRHQVECTIQMLWEERNEYHNKCQSMMKHLERLTKERAQVLGIFLKGDSLRKNKKDESDDKAVLDDCRKWLADQEGRTSSRIRYEPRLAAASAALHHNKDAMARTTTSAYTSTHVEEGYEKKKDNDIQTTVVPGA
jgi:chromosome segregation ATPase